MFAPQLVANDDNAADPVGQETLRRQRIMRFGLIICLLFLVFDNGSQVGNQTPSGPRTSSWHTEIPLSDQYGVKIQAILSQQSFSHSNIQKPINSSGLFRGPWNVVADSHNTSKEDSGPDGSVLVQLVSVPVRNLPDMSFVYGLLHLYKNPEMVSRSHQHQRPQQDVGFPVQGVVVSSQRKMVLFSTPYRSQRLYVRLASKHHFGNYSIVNSTNSDTAHRRQLLSGVSGAATGRQRQRGHEIIELELTTGQDGHEGGTAHSQTTQLFDFHPQLSVEHSPYQAQQISAGIIRNLLSHLSTSSAAHSVESPSTQAETFKTQSRAHRTLSETSLPVVRLGDSAAFSMQVLGFGETRRLANNEVLLTDLSEAGFLSVLLADQPLTAHKGSSETNLTTGGADNSTVTSPTRNRTEGEFLISIALGETVLPGKFKALQSTALAPALRLSADPVLHWGNKTAGQVSKSSAVAAQECQYLGQLTVDTKSNRADRSTGPTQDLSGEVVGGAVETVGGGSSASVEAPTVHSNSSKAQPPAKLDPALALSGTLSSGDCGKMIAFEATTFNLEFNTLKVKVELYALVASLLSLVQVFLVIYQMNHSNTQAQASKISLVSLFGQSLLDANLCMAHALLSVAFPMVFFTSFIWICVLKLLLFAVLLMRFIINTYQARYAQELAVEGMNGFRRRIIGLHASFYGVLLVALLVSIALYKRPVLAVFTMYSFWLPQVIYSAYMGTKHSFHPMYLVGVSLCHLFTPLYILGCPNNFLGLLTVYTNPHYLAEIAGEHGPHAHDLHHLSLSSVSACWVLVIWMTAQVGMLLLQTALGPRFFVPKKWLPSRYDYKRPIPDNMRAAFPVSNSSGSEQSTPRGSGRNDSPGDIAMTGIRSRGSASSASRVSSYGGLQALFGYGRASATAEDEEDMETGRLLGDSSVHPSAPPSGESNPGGMDCAICCNLIHFNSRDNLITPCDHVFHEECLERWTHVKLECPVCRSTLPSLGDD